MLLAAGFTHVIGASWPVRDDASVIQSVRFDQLRRDEQHLPIAEALRRTQVWLRDSTGAELADWLEETVGDDLPDIAGVQAGDTEIATARLLRILRTQPGVRPFGHPIDWAAFTLTVG